jgi:hypothetical protein
MCLCPFEDWIRFMEVRFIVRPLCCNLLSKHHHHHHHYLHLHQFNVQVDSIAYEQWGLQLETWWTAEILGDACLVAPYCHVESVYTMTTAFWSIDTKKGLCQEIKTWDINFLQFYVSFLWLLKLLFQVLRIWYHGSTFWLHFKEPVMDLIWEE